MLQNLSVLQRMSKYTNIRVCVCRRKGVQYEERRLTLMLALQPLGDAPVSVYVCCQICKSFFCHPLQATSTASEVDGQSFRKDPVTEQVSTAAFTASMPVTNTLAWLLAQAMQHNQCALCCPAQRW